MQIRDYQQKALDCSWKELQNKPSTYIVLPTGTGKTYVFTLLAEKWRKEKNERVLIVCPSRRLVEQSAEVCRTHTKLNVGVDMGVEHWADRECDVIVTTYQTGVRRLNKFIPDHFGLVIFDECDLSLAESYGKISKYFAKAKLFGCTATPKRHDGQELAGIFTTLAHEESIEDMINAQYVSRISRRRYEILRVTKEIVEANEDLIVQMKNRDFDQAWLDKIFSAEKHLHEVVRPMLETAGNRPTIVFGVSINHVERLTELFNRYRPGCARAVSSESKTPKEILKAFERREFQFIVNCMILNRGVDLPLVSCIGMARPTMSHTLYMQMLGRGTRVFNDKENLLVVDFTYNSETHDIKGDDGLTVNSKEVKSVSVTDVLLSNSDDDREAAVLADEILGDAEGDVLEAVKEARERLNLDESLKKRIRAIVEYRERTIQDGVEAKLYLLREMYGQGMSKPTAKSPLGRALHNYLSPAAGCFRPNLREEFKRWFPVKVLTEDKIRLLREMYARGEDKPLYKTSAWYALMSYTSPSANSFRPELRKEFERWFVDTIQDNIKQLRRLYKEGGKKPSSRSSLGQRLRTYTNPTSRYFCPELRKEFANWFQDIGPEDKIKQLREIYERGEKRPSDKTLRRALHNYTSPASRSFRPELRKEFKRWFPKKVRVEEKIRQLREIYHQGAEKPDKETLLGEALFSYTKFSSNSFRPNLREEFKRWFPEG